MAAADSSCIPRIQVDQLEDWTVEHPTPDGEKHSMLTGNSNSLPNLLEGGSMSVVRENNQPPSVSIAIQEAKQRQACHHVEGDKLCIYCSPRCPRRQVLLRGGGHRRDGGTRPKTFHVGGADSDSDSSVRSASHISTCASLDFRNTAFSSRISLADNGYESSASLRRICSNPETPLDCLSPASDGPVITKDCSGCTRSCTNLQVLSSVRPPGALMSMSTPAESFPQALCEALTKSTSMQNGTTVSPTEDLRSSIPKEARNVRVLRWLEGLDRGGANPGNTQE